MAVSRLPSLNLCCCGKRGKFPSDIMTEALRAEISKGRRLQLECTLGVRDCGRRCHERREAEAVLEREAKPE